MNEIAPLVPVVTRHPLERVTLTDVAKCAGVSKVAVSVVLHQSNSQRVKVSDATRQRILDAAETLKYQPNVLARSLRHRTTNVIGFYSARYTLDPVHPFYGMLLRGLAYGCDDHQKCLMMHGAFSHISEDAIYQELLNGQIDGLILYAREKSPLVDRLAEAQLPVITVVNEVSGLPWVTADNEQGGRITAQYLARQGYRSVLYATGEAVLPLTIQSRYQAFKTEAEALGMRVELCNLGEYGKINPETARTVLQARKDFQAIACYNDSTADDLYALCRQLHIRVPQDLAIMGFDGLEFAPRNSPKLTTVRAPWDDVARKAVELLVAHCKGETIPLKTTLPVELLVGDTA